MPVHLAVSDASGKSWSEPANTGLIGQVSSPLSFGNGLMACIYQSRFAKPGLRAILSLDNGATWDEATDVELLTADQAAGNNNPFQAYQAFTFGYSNVLKSGDHEALVSCWWSNGKTTYIRICGIEVTDQ